MSSLLALSPRTPPASGQKYFEMPKTQTHQPESRPTRTLPFAQPTSPPFGTAPIPNTDSGDPTCPPVKELLDQPRGRQAKMSVQLGNTIAQPEPGQHLPYTPADTQPTSGSLPGPLFHVTKISTTGERKPIGRIGMSHKKEAITMDFG